MAKIAKKQERLIHALSNGRLVKATDIATELAMFLI